MAYGTTFDGNHRPRPTTERGLPRRYMVLLLGPLLGIGCVAEQAPAPPEAGLAASALISDEVHSGGTEGFFFLPPMVPQTARFTGEFEPRLEPDVRIDRVDASGRTLAVVAHLDARQRGPERLRRHPRREFYVARWHSRHYALNSAFTYRVRVFVDGHELGFADVDVVRTEAEARRVDRSKLVPLRNGEVLPIKFRIEEQAVDGDHDGVVDWEDNCPTVANPPPRPRRDEYPTRRTPSGCDHEHDDCDPQETDCLPKQNPEQTDSDGDGVGDACECLTVACTAPDSCHSPGSCDGRTGTCVNAEPLPDGDLDGACDAIDGCPGDAGKTDPGLCGCGVADTDSDGDGSPDCDGHDLCPFDAGKTDPGACGCGVSDADGDGDGTPDCHDQCPSDPAKNATGACGCEIPDDDSDGDGVADCVDGCPGDPLKTMPTVCGCGHADADSDADGTADCHDGCPIDPNKVLVGACGCGVADTDGDGDGTADCSDGCPADGRKTEPGVCGCGAADTDADGDGTLDCQDECTTDPGKTAPGVCGCGIADADGDGDGILDCVDACPGDADKAAGAGTCGCGTPDSDTDGDGTLDCHDECTTDPGKTSPGACGCGVPDADPDGDGSPSCLDGCPGDGAKTAPGVCGCGFSDVDSDDDGIADCNDACAGDPDKFEPGVCGCAVPDEDADGDGSYDCEDACPHDADKVDPGQCGCGAQDLDSDGDGTADCVDACPDDESKTSPGVCGCATAEDDDDGDGTPNCNDGCPDDATKIESGFCGCGQPERDDDGDGLVDCKLDPCLNDPANDADGDGICETQQCPPCTGPKCGACTAADNCPETFNPKQPDTDGDGQGDDCECIGVVCPASAQCLEAGVCDSKHGQCVYAAVPDGTACDDGDLCTDQDQCTFGECSRSNPVTCDDGLDCTDDACDPDQGTCTNVSNAVTYQDADGDGYGDASMPSMTCPPPPGYVDSTGDCDDGNPGINPVAPEDCNGLDDDCDGALGFFESDDDGDGYRVCDGDCNDDDPAAFPGAPELCNAGLDLSCDGAPPSCDDGDVCTADACGASGACEHDAISCDDGNLCTQDACDPRTGCVSSPASDGAACDDSNACTVWDVCVAGACLGGDPVQCLKSDQCHDQGTCDPGTGQCSDPPSADGTACTVAGACSTVLFTEDWENGPGRWYTIDGGPIEIVSDSTLCRSRVQHESVSFSGGRLYTRNSIPVQPGRAHCLSAWARASAGTIPFLGIELADAAGVPLVQEHWLIGSAGYGTGYGGDVVTPVTSDGEWHWYAKEFTPEPSASYLVLKHEIVVQFGAGSGDFDQIQLFDGPCPAAPTACAPATESCAPAQCVAGTCVLGCDDADGDGVCTNADNCPDTANPLQEDTGGDGVGDACEPPRSITAGSAHSCATVGDGQVYCWGNNSFGQLGDGTTIGSARPVAVRGLSDAIAVGAGGSGALAHSCAVRANGQVACWGFSTVGQLGDGTAVSSSTPVTVVGLSDAVAIEVGVRHSCAVRANGQVACWGRGNSSQLGNGGELDSSTPVTVVGLADAIAVAAGEQHTCALRSTGEVVCWGWNTVGQLGDGTFATRATPVAVFGLSDAVGISVGSSHSCAARANGQVACWGNNANGQLGDGTLDSRTTPVTVLNIGDFVAVAAGQVHTCGLRSMGAVACWGGNFTGQLGNGTTNTSTTPVTVLGLPDAVAVGAGASHTCAVRHGTDDVVCWGWNGSGQIGNGVAGPNALTPADVIGLP